MRLHYPSVEHLNEDFICGICKSKLYPTTFYVLINLPFLIYRDCSKPIRMLKRTVLRPLLQDLHRPA